MDYSFLTKTALFADCTEEDIRAMLSCLRAAVRVYERGEILCHAGDPATTMGMVLSGQVTVENYDVWGTRSILDVLGPGQVYAESYACLPGEKLMVTVCAAEKSEILLMDPYCLVAHESKPCPYSMRLMRNLLTVSAQKNLSLARRIFHTSAKTIRGRLTSYLSYQSLLHDGRDFDIPFNRQQLADYLGVDRSALSAEMSRMQSDGLLTFRKNHIHLLALPEDHAE